MNLTFFLKYKIHLLLGLIILSGLFLRLYKLPETFYYTMDEEVMNLIQRRIILKEHFPLIGSVSAISTYLGPYFYYLGSIFLFLSNLNPLGQAVFAGLLGTFNIFLIYIVSRQLFDKRIAIFSSIFYSLSFLMVIFDRRYWHLTFGPFLSLIVLWSLFKIKNGSYKFIYLLTLALILGINTDYTNLVLVLFTVIAWIVFKLPLMKRQLLVSLLIFLISSLPILVFDLRHDFLNTKAFISYFTKNKQDQRNFSDRESLGKNKLEQGIIGATLPFLTYSRILFMNSDPNIAEQHTYCKAYIISRNNQQGKLLPIITGLLLVLFVFISWKKIRSKENLGFKLVLSYYLIFQSGILIYAFVFGGDVFEHYLSTLMPYLMIISAIIVATLYDLRYRFVSLSLIVLFVLVNLKIYLSSNNGLSFNNKLQAARYALEKVGSKEYSLDSISSCYKWDGYFYPFVYLGKHPVKSYQDPNYSWLYNYQPAEVHPDRVVVMVAKGRFEDKKFNETYKRYAKWVIDRKTFGDLEVLILDNSKGDF